ncbi:MAG: hypothetical protein EXS13_10075 [Planctomycetes bacterium]|nr:hypothetical protein [Planctomycetota bacterium]
MQDSPAPLEQPFDFAPQLPGSKSIANRALVIAALAHGATVFRRLPPSADVAAMVAGLRALRMPIEEVGEGRVAVGGPRIGGWLGDGSGLVPLERTPLHARTLDCGLGGTTARFLLALAAVVPGRWTITGGARLRERPMAELLDALAQLGVPIEGDARALPVTLLGGVMRGGRVRLNASRSSQFLSALLLVGAATEQGLEIELEGALASTPYVDMTLDVLAWFGVEVEVEVGVGVGGGGGSVGRTYRVAPQQAHGVDRFVVDADCSAAGAWMVLARLARSAVQFVGLPRLTTPMPPLVIRQPDSVLPELLAQLDRARDGRGERNDERDERGASAAVLTIDIVAAPDQLMNLAVAAAARRGTTRFVGAANLRLKESDRLAVLAEQLGRAGVKVVVEPDGLVVEGRATLRPATLDCCGDHRMAIAFALLASLQPGITLVGAECVEKSDPGFFAELARARASPRCIALVGMRGAGKTTLAKALATRLRLDAHDSDASFVARHGPIGCFVAAHGWPRFREIEAELVAELLAPGRVVALGGGAVESEATRERLRRAAIVLHLEEALSTLRQRLAAAPRPSLTGADSLAELPELLVSRAPHYREVATITLAPGRSVAERVEEAVAALRSLVRW